MPTALREPHAPEVPARRELGRLWIATLVLFAVVFCVAALAFLWPNRAARDVGVSVGAVHEIQERLADGLPLYNAEGDFFLVPHLGGYEEAAVAGVMALVARSTHLGQPLVYCVDSETFIDLRQGSIFNIAGEVLPGSPAPEGLWRYPLEVRDGELVVDTSRWLAGPKWGRYTAGMPDVRWERCLGSPTGDRIVGVAR